MNVNTIAYKEWWVKKQEGNPYRDTPFSSKWSMGDKYNDVFPRRQSAGKDCVQVGDKYFKIYYDCTNYEPHMWHPEYAHLRNIVETKRIEITKEEYKNFLDGPNYDPEPPENYL